MHHHCIIGAISVALFDISISNIDCRYIDNINIDMAVLENIGIDIDIDKETLEYIDIDKISNRLKFGISNRAIYQCIISA